MTFGNSNSNSNSMSGKTMGTLNSLQTPNLTIKRFSHGQIAMLDSELRRVWHSALSVSDDTGDHRHHDIPNHQVFPLSFALLTSARMKLTGKVTRRLFVKGVRAITISTGGSVY